MRQIATDLVVSGSSVCFIKLPAVMEGLVKAAIALRQLAGAMADDVVLGRTAADTESHPVNR